MANEEMMLWCESPELWKVHANANLSLIEVLVLFSVFGLWRLEFCEWFDVMFGVQDVVTISGVEVSGCLYFCHVFLTLIRP